MKRLYSIPEASTELNICRVKVYDEIASGRLEALKIGRRTVIESSAIDRYIQNLPRMQSAAA